MEGKKEVLGLWIGENEGAKFWLGIFTELKNRGMQDIFIACVDGLKGLPEAIHAVFPETSIQLCIIHMIRNSTKYVAYKNVKSFVSDLKLVYRAISVAEAEKNLDKLQDRWMKQYPLAVKPWIKHWDNIKTLFSFYEDVRCIIYTTNAVEILHRQFRKVTKNRSIFPHDDSLMKLLFLSVENASKKWTQPLANWQKTLAHFSIMYENRVQIGFNH